MDTDAKFRANALIHKITSSKDAFFDAVAAKKLVATIPVTHGSPISFERSIEESSSDVKGYSPGFGQISIDGRSRRTEWSSNAEDIQRVGGYKIEHKPGVMSIEELWAGTYEDQSGTKCVLYYDKKTKEPLNLKLLKMHSFSFSYPSSLKDLFLLNVKNFVKEVYSFGYYVPWKKPSYDNN